MAQAPVDVVVVGFGWTGAIMAEALTETGLKVLALERGNSRASASGAMTEVIYFSTSRMSDTDLEAIAIYLKDAPPSRRAPQSGTADTAALRAGEAIFVDTCAACHRSQGRGEPGYSPLARDAALQARDPTTLVRIILQGARAAPTPEVPYPLFPPATAPSVIWEREGQLPG